MKKKLEKQNLTREGEVGWILRPCSDVSREVN